VACGGMLRGGILGRVHAGRAATREESTREECHKSGTGGRRRTLVPERLLLARQVGHLRWRPTVRCMYHVPCVIFTHTQ
jgi:hypothetical protein